MRSSTIALATILCFMLNTPGANAAPSATTAPHATPSLYRVATTQKLVSFTFDDGPSPTTTPAILQRLQRYGDRASFFVLGVEAERFPQVLKQIVSQGSSVENHGFAHINLYGKSASSIIPNITRCSQLVAQTTGRGTQFFRPPFGTMSSRINQLIRGTHQIPTIWSIDTRDWAMPGIPSIVFRVTHDLKSGDIILMHDGGGDRSQTLAALDVLLPALQSHGYRSVPLAALWQSGWPIGGTEKPWDKSALEALPLAPGTLPKSGSWKIPTKPLTPAASTKAERPKSISRAKKSKIDPVWRSETPDPRP